MKNDPKLIAKGAAAAIKGKVDQDFDLRAAMDEDFIREVLVELGLRDNPAMMSHVGSVLRQENLLIEKPYPKMLYQPQSDGTITNVTVQDEKEDKALKGVWYDTIDEAKDVAAGKTTVKAKK